VQRIKIIESEVEFASLSPLWEELFASCARASQVGTPASTPVRISPTLFQTYKWNEIAARLFSERERPHVVVVESDSGAAIIPACVKRNGMSFLGEELFDYRDVLSTDDALLESAWREVDRLGMPLRVKAVRGERSFGVSKSFAGAPYRAAAHIIARNKKLERNLRLLREAGCRLSSYRAIAPSGDRFARVVRRMYELKGRSEDGSLFTDSLRIDAVVQLAATADCELHTIEKDDEFVAAILTLIDENVCRFYGTYYDERWAVYSPGVSLLYRVIRDAEQRGLDFDFMTGEQPYKMRFATEVVPLYIVERAAVASLAA
jgi:CelD/BcsL family acetyltransferase involved in cellulose biosynthesis